jgi:hypothetical protein
MAISGISSNPLSILTQLGAYKLSSANTNNQASATPKSPPSGGMMESILQILSSMSDGSSTNSSPATGASANGAESLQSFVQSLASAIHAQQGPQSSNTTSSAAGMSPIIQPHHHHGRHSGMGKAEAGVQSLLDQLSASDTNAASSNNASSQSVANLKLLEQNANQLFAGLGIPSGNSSLTTFLSSLKQSMAGAGSVGNFVVSKA